MNILIVHPCKRFYGGAEEVVQQLCRQLTDKHQVLLVTKDSPLELYKNEARHIRTREYTDFRWQVQKWAYDWADIINTHNFPANLAAYPLKPVVWYCNEPPELFSNWWRKPIEAFNRRWVKKSGMNVVVADRFNACRFEKIYGIQPRIIPYGVDYEFWSKAKRITQGGTIRLLQVGTISRYKNQLKSIHQLAEMLRRGADATLTLAGGATDGKYYDALVYRNIPAIEDDIPGFNSKVIFLGQQTQEQIRDLYSNHDVLLHPVVGQGGWLVPFEAMCACLPVIVGPEFPASTLIGEKGLGIVDSSRGLVAVEIITTRKHEEMLDMQRIKSWVKDNMTWEKFAGRMVETFEEALGERHSG